MAAPHVFAVFTIMDAKGAKSVTKINFPDAVNIGMVKDFINGGSSTAGMIDALIKGRILDAGIGLAVALPAGLKAAALPDSDVEEGARFQFKAASGAITGFRLPTFDETFIISGSKNVDTANATVNNLVQRMLQGRTVGAENASPSDDRGSDITELVSAREEFGKNRT